MEEIIRNIVEADKQARTAVEEKKQERQNIQNLIQEQDKTIKEKYQKETKQCVAEKKAEMDAKLSEQMQQEQSELASALQSLQQKYDEHRQEWVDAIVGRCLAT